MSIHTKFPKLATTNHNYTSPQTVSYNCIAWAAANQNQWWWPDQNQQYYWPAGVPREETLQAFTQAYETIGYEICDNPSLEEGFEKIAIYSLLGRITHASRQLPDGMWTSKLGQYVDLSHEFNGLDGPEYGDVVLVMKKRSHLF